MVGRHLAVRRRAGHLVAAGVACSIAGACGDDDGAPAAPAAAKPRPAAAPARVPAATAGVAAAPAKRPRPAPPAVILLDAGRKPRRALRYRVSGSYRDRIDMTVSVGMNMGVSGGAKDVGMQLPDIRMSMDVSADGEPGPDRAAFRFVITDAAATGGSAELSAMNHQVSAEIKKAIGAAGRLVIDPRGVQREVELDLPPEMDPRMSENMRWSRQSMEQMSVPLPEEPVGVGARWQVEQLVELNGLAVQQRTELELVSLEKMRAGLRTTITQRADQQLVALPGIPAGYKAELISHTGEGSGNFDFDLTRLVPRGSTVRIGTTTSVRVAGQGEDQVVRMRTQARVTVERR